MAIFNCYVNVHQRVDDFANCQYVAHVERMIPSRLLWVRNLETKKCDLSDAKKKRRIEILGVLEIPYRNNGWKTSHYPPIKQNISLHTLIMIG